jgi:hypothetical protein
MAAKGSFSRCTQRKNGAYAAFVERIGHEFNALHLHMLKGMRQHQVLDVSIESGLLERIPQPAVTNGQSAMLAVYLIVASAACVLLCSLVEYNKRE